MMLRVTMQCLTADVHDVIGDATFTRIMSWTKATDMDNRVSIEEEAKRLREEIKILKEGRPVGGEEISIGSYLLARLEQLGVKVSLDENRVTS